MVNFSRKTAKLFQIVLGAILGCLGFAGCKDDHYDMYGSPTADFEIKGAVTKEMDNVPVENATIILNQIYTDSPNEGYPIKSVETDADGRYNISITYHPVDKIRIVCVPPEGSGLDADSVDVETKYTGGDGDYYWGSMTCTADFKLKEK